MLYVVATPIGNLEEITLRALRVLREADYILCEDCGHSLKLLNHYEISKPLKRYQKFNERVASGRIIADLKAGKNIALITDAGMPCISDPGSILLRECIAEKVEYTVVSGASAAINAVVLSGMDAPFCFVGFLPEKKKKREELLNQYNTTPAALVFYSPPHNLNYDLQTLYEVFGSREISIIKEISKMHESIEHTVLRDGLTFEARGEYVLVVRGAEKIQDSFEDKTVEQCLIKLLSSGLDTNSAIKQVAAQKKLSKNEVYQVYISQIKAK